ncbi:MAG: glutathione S-transferase [Proteobacteria bacterium]|nr:glutathione S-transferase [Pseudomonadota bacterium]
MRLFWSSRSPYVRKVMIVAHEIGLADGITCIPTVVSTTETDLDLVACNPLGQIPSLVLDDGTVIYDSAVICEYLDGLHSGRRLFPPIGLARLDALRRQALGDGLMDALVRRFAEHKRQQAPRHSDYIEAYRRKVRRGLDVLDAEAPPWMALPFDIGHVAIGCALSYADFRFGGDNWRDGRPRLSAWYRDFANRASAKATELTTGTEAQPNSPRA